MTISTYRFHAKRVHPAWSYFYSATPPLTRAGLSRTLAGVTIHELADSSGGHHVHIELARSTHDDAIAQIEAALAQFAFYTVQIEVTEWATALVEGALIGGSGGGALGAATRNVVGLVAGVLVGGILGAIFGQSAWSPQARYRADRIAPGWWQLMQLPVPQQGLGGQRWRTDT